MLHDFIFLKKNRFTRHSSLFLILDVFCCGSVLVRTGAQPFWLFWVMYVCVYTYQYEIRYAEQAVSACSSTENKEHKLFRTWWANRWEQIAGGSADITKALLARYTPVACNIRPFNQVIQGSWWWDADILISSSKRTSPFNTLHGTTCARGGELGTEIGSQVNRKHLSSIRTGNIIRDKKLAKTNLSQNISRVIHVIPGLERGHSITKMI